MKDEEVKLQEIESLTLLEIESSHTLRLFIITEKTRVTERKSDVRSDGVGAMKDKELKLEDFNTPSHTRRIGERFSDGSV
jgi:hypothetical protein